jgi:hypothetical protein
MTRYWAKFKTRVIKTDLKLTLTVNFRLKFQILGYFGFFIFWNGNQREYIAFSKPVSS